jgi:hypothetical protein
MACNPAAPDGLSIEPVHETRWQARGRDLLARRIGGAVAGINA